MSEVVVQVRTYDDADVVRMVAEVQAEYVQRYGAPDEAAVDAAEFAEPLGLFFVGLVDGEAVATGGWRRLSDGDAEIKRMYVASRARRRGVARLMLAEVERTATSAGVMRLVLNTGDKQPEAIALYAQAGYTPVPGWGRYAGYPDAVFLGKRLV